MITDQGVPQNVVLVDAGAGKADQNLQVPRISQG